MEFQDLYRLVTEAKGTKPGERFNSVKNTNGPAGVSSSPIGKSNYNPELPERRDTGPRDIGFSNVQVLVRLLSKGLALLKDDETFEDQIKGALLGFKRNRKQISIEQESILKNYEKIIDKYDGQISQYTKRLFSAKDTFYHTDVVKGKNKKGEDTASMNVQSYTSSGSQESSRAELEEKLEEIKAKRAEYSEILENTRNDTDMITQENEELNNEYLDQVLTAVKYTSKRLYKIAVTAMGEEKPEFKTIVPIHELDVDMIEMKSTKDLQIQLQLLEMLMSEDENINPLIKFLALEEINYDSMKDRAFELKHGDNYSITIELLYKTLPLFKLSNFYYSVIMKKASIPLNMKQAKSLNSKTADGGILGKLDSVKSELQFDNIKPELIEYIQGLEVSDTYRSALMSIVNGKFETRKGSPNAAFKIKSSLKSMNLTESFDDYASRILSSYQIDEDDFKIDLVEMISEKCDGPTKKASSDRKGKKWMKCAKQSDGSYKKIHWGQAGVRVTGKSGNTKRKKSFKARHNCANAKPGSPNSESCKDWN